MIDYYETRSQPINHTGNWHILNVVHSIKFGVYQKSIYLWKKEYNEKSIIKTRGQHFPRD